MHFLISENEFAHEIKCDGMTSFTDFMTQVSCPGESATAAARTDAVSRGWEC